MQTLVTKNEAAAMLDRACRSVELYANKGLLSPVQKGPRVFFDKVEVESLRVSLQTGKDLETLRLEKRVSKLEQEVALLMRILQSRRRLPLTEGEAVLLRSKAEQALLHTRHQVQTCENWALALSDLTEEDFKRAGRGAWVVFHKLCLHLIDYLVQHKDFGRSLAKQKAHALLLRARSSMRSELITLLSESDAKRYEKLFGEPLDPKKEVFALL